MEGKRFALVRALWARPPYDESIFHEKKLFLHFFHFAKHWIESCLIYSTHEKMEFVCCERCDLARKNEFTFCELFKFAKNDIPVF